MSKINKTITRLSQRLLSLKFHINSTDEITSIEKIRLQSELKSIVNEFNKVCDELNKKNIKK